VVLATPLPAEAAKSFGGGGRSFSSGSRSSSSSSFSSGRSGYSASRSSGGGYQGAGKSYSAPPPASGGSGRGYTAGHAYSAGGAAPPPAARAPSGPGFDSEAARARSTETSRASYSRYKEAQRTTYGAGGSSRPPVNSYSANRTYYHTTYYVADSHILITRPYRTRTMFGLYYSRPMVVYNDPYSSFFWWWLLDRSLDDQAWWAYHHRYDMDPARYSALMAHDQALEARVAQLEAQQAPRNAQFTPAGLDQDLMYSDNYVNQPGPAPAPAPQADLPPQAVNRPVVQPIVTTDPGPMPVRQSASLAVALPLAALATGFFIWLIWFKRW